MTIFAHCSIRLFFVIIKLSEALDGFNIKIYPHSNVFCPSQRLTLIINFFHNQAQFIFLFHSNLLPSSPDTRASEYLKRNEKKCLSGERVNARDFKSIAEWYLWRMFESKSSEIHTAICYLTNLYTTTSTTVTTTTIRSLSLSNMLNWQSHEYKLIECEEAKHTKKTNSKRALGDNATIRDVERELSEKRD